MKSTSKGASAQIVSHVLKCREGDIAILLYGPNTGLIVDVVKYYGVIAMSDGEVLVDAWQVKHPSDEPEIDYFRQDRYLLPIRPGDLEEIETDEKFIHSS